RRRGLRLGPADPLDLLQALALAPRLRGLAALAVAQAHHLGAVAALGGEGDRARGAPDEVAGVRADHEEGAGRGVVAHGAPLCCPVAQIVNNYANTSAPPGASGTVPAGRAPNPRAPNPRARRRPPASRETRRPPRTPPAGRMPAGRGGRCRRGAGAGS